MKGRGSRTKSLFLSIIIRICVLVCVGGGGGGGRRGSGESHMKIVCETSTKKGWGRRYLV